MKNIINFPTKLALLLSLSLASVSVNAQTKPLNFGEPYDKDVPYSSIAAALLTGDIRTFTNLISDPLAQYLKDEDNQKDLSKMLKEQVDKALAVLNGILNDTKLSDTQKNDAINNVVDASILPYKSQPIGTLSAFYNYSLDYGIARLNYTVSSKDSYCGQEWHVSGHMGPNGQFIVTGGSWERWYAVRMPQISVYRITADGNEKLITTMASKDFPRSALWTVPFTQGGIARELWNDLRVYYRFKQQGDTSAQTSIDVPTELYLRPSSKLSYKLVATYPSIARCDNGSDAKNAVTEQSIIDIRTDENGKVDIIPSEIYDSYMAVINGPKIIPIITSVLDD